MIRLIEQQVRMDSYPQLILLFYRKATARHTRKMLLIRKLHALLQAVAHLLSLQPTDSPLAEVAAVSPREGRDKWLFASAKLHKALLFAVFNALISNDDILCFKMVEEKLNIELEQSGLGDSTLRSISQEWTRIGQLLLNRKKLRWEKLLLEAIRKFPPEFHELVFRLLTKRPLSAENGMAEIGQLLRNVAEEAHVRMVYFEVEGRRVRRVERFGEGAEIVMGWAADERSFVVAERVPAESEEERRREAALQELRINAEDMLGEFKQGSSKLVDLAAFASFTSKEERILSYLEGRR